MALAFVTPAARVALGALALLACGRIDLGSREVLEGPGGSSSIERPTPPPRISIGDVIRTEITPGSSGSDSTVTIGGDGPIPDDATADGTPAIADAGGALDAGSASPTVPGTGVTPGSIGDAGAADGGSCDPAPSCSGESCCAPSLVPVGAL
jgi:hypothetical protein